MGQTLSHGVYLPAEGERNCYSGLASNWNLLDTAIGDTAGKASATHTHGNISSDGKVGTTANLPLITGTGGVVQAGAFGNQANTFCEGNDSRLSDARTPVAHTHAKSDVTDLLNSNFIPSANNSYDLGSSSYQWNNLYAKNYYYNGTAWGLDKDNQWLKNQSFIGERLGTEDSANTNTCLTLYGRYDTVQSSGMIFTRMRSNSSQGGLNDNAASRLGIDVLENGVRTTNALLVNIKGYNSETGLFTRCELYSPLASSRLGTSTNKWKSLNGINPGALSLPDYNNVLDVTSEVPIASLDGNTQININDYLADKTGWLNIVIDDTAGNSIIVTQGKSGGATAFNNSRTFHTGAQSNGYISVFFPIIAGTSKIAFIKASSLIQMRFYYCLGNV